MNVILDGFHFISFDEFSLKSGTEWLIAKVLSFQIVEAQTLPHEFPCCSIEDSFG